MTELEERMYRLSEALKRVEPENSSRLMSGVKYARDELILHEMQEIRDILTRSDYKLASGEQKEMVVKLQRLEEMLLSTDLDLQLQLQKLRLMRDIMKRLDTAIAEEDREQKRTVTTNDQDKRLQNLPKLREKLADLIRRETEHVELASKLIDGKVESSPVEIAAPAQPESNNQGAMQKDPVSTYDGANKKSDNPNDPPSVKLFHQQQQTRDDTKSLEQPLPELSEAREEMDQSLKLLEKQALGEALPHQKDALESLKKLAALLDKSQKDLAMELSQERFNSMKQDQQQNHSSTDKITDMLRELGDSGAGAIGEVGRATGSMGNAESKLGDRQPEPAGEQQTDALAALKYAREQLAQEEEKLLNQVRAEVKKRVLEGITEMLERQVTVRESTQRFAPRLKEGSRQVLTSVVALSKSEEQIMQIDDGLISMVEESEFGIALPATLRAVDEEMDDVKQQLAAGEATEDVVSAEKQIESDLKELLECMKQLPSSGKSDNKKSPDGQDRQRELNRIIAELKMIRMLQTRVNRDTKHTDDDRTARADHLSAELQQRLQALHDRQQDVEDVTDKLITERGNEVQQ
ncbi:MAG TPA: hypothetical protein VFE46_18210 [Pirellulales bacterium]|nr:hypothetical protein [Pirellulales bacterium]